MVLETLKIIACESGLCVGKKRNRKFDQLLGPGNDLSPFFDVDPNFVKGEKNDSRPITEQKQPRSQID